MPVVSSDMTTIDLGPATTRVAELVAGVADLDAPTPCTGTPIGGLLDHINLLSAAFASAARKDGEFGSTAPPEPDAANLPADWRTSIPQRLDELAAAWRAPGAWEGMTKAGGLDMPGEVAGVVALDEVVLHGWDLAQATGQAYDVDEETVTACLGFVSQFSGPGQEEMRGDAFAPVVAVPDDAPLLDRLVGLSGRDPAWTAPAG